MTINNEHKKLNVPNLRFKEFQGEWEKCKLGDICAFLSGGTPKIDIKEYWDGTIPFVSAISMHNTYISDSNLHISEKGLKNGSKLLKKNNLLLLVRGSMLWKSIPVCLNESDVAFNQDVKGIIPNDTTNNKFLLYWLKSKEQRLKYMVTGTGLGAGKLDTNDLLSMSVYAPSMNEQDKIAKLLSLLDKRIATQNKIIDKLQSLIKGIRNKLFENDKDWRKAKIREFLCIGNGKDYKHLDIGDIPVYGTGGKMLSVNDFLYDGDSVCIGRKGTIDTPLFLTGKFWTVDTLFYTYGFKDVLPKFCYYLFKQINWQLYNEGTGVPSLSKSTIENIKVRIPSIVQQYKICYILDSYEDKIKNEGLILDLYCSQKQYLLRQMFV